MNESTEELGERAQRLGESILYPMLETIKHVAEHEVAGEDLVMDADTIEEAEDFVQHLRDLGVMAKVMEFNDGKAVIRRIHQSTTDKINNYINGGLY
jgi:putative ATP-dependent DNA ligase